MPGPRSWLTGKGVVISTWAEWQGSRRDTRSLLTPGDPLFANPQSGDYRLSPDSPAAKFGCKGFLDGAAPDMTVSRDFFGKSRHPAPSAGAFEAYPAD